MQEIFIGVLCAVLLVVMALAVCIACDSLDRKRRLKRLRRDMLSYPDISDEQFVDAMKEIEASRVLEMRRMLAAMLGIDSKRFTLTGDCATSPF